MRCASRVEGYKPATHLLEDNEVQREEIFLVVEKGELVQHVVITDELVDLLL